jgi:hypothetical protein
MGWWSSFIGSNFLFFCGLFPGYWFQVLFRGAGLCIVEVFPCILGFIVFVSVLVDFVFF